MDGDKMEKIQFRYQSWYLKILCSGIILPLIFGIQYLFATVLNIEYANFGYLFVCGIIAIVGFCAYFKCAQYREWFERKGVYWVENGTVYIQKQNKTHEIKNIKWLRGTTVSAYGAAKAGMLVVKYGEKKMVLVASSKKSVESFSDSELRPLFEIILEYNTELIKDGALDFFYEATDA